MYLDMGSKHCLFYCCRQSILDQGCLVELRIKFNYLFVFSICLLKTLIPKHTLAKTITGRRMNEKIIGGCSTFKGQHFFPCMFTQPPCAITFPGEQFWAKWSYQLKAGRCHHCAAPWKSTHCNCIPKCVISYNMSQHKTVLLIPALQ